MLFFHGKQCLAYQTPAYSPTNIMNIDRYNLQNGENSPHHGRHAHRVSDTNAEQDGVCRVEPMMINGVVIPRREADGYYNATVICETCSKSFADFMQEERTGEVLDAISSIRGVALDSIVQKGEGGNAGTSAAREIWIHPILATDLAQWSSVRFAVEYSRNIYEFFKAKLATNSIPDYPPEIADIMKSVTDCVAQGMRRDAERN